MRELRSAPAPVSTNPALLLELNEHLQVCDDAKDVIEGRLNDFEHPTPFLDEIDPRDAYYLQYLAAQGRNLEARVRMPQIDPLHPDEVKQHLASVQAFLAAQPAFAKEFLLSKPIQAVAADADRLEQIEIPRLRAEYEALLKENEAIRKKLWQIPDI
jgi:hypothetical protein